LPREVQGKVIQAFTLFRENREHPLLVIKKIMGMEGVWEGQIDRNVLKPLSVTPGNLYHPPIRFLKSPNLRARSFMSELKLKVSSLGKISWK